jgi:two-component system NtrC family sensor kinase
MPRTSPAAPRAVTSASPAAALSLVADVAAAVAAGGPLDELVPRALARVRASTGAECAVRTADALWSAAGSADAAAWLTGAATIRSAVDAVLADVPGVDAPREVGDVRLVPMRAGGRVVGVLAARSESGLRTAIVALTTVAVADVLAPAGCRGATAGAARAGGDGGDDRWLMEAIVDALPLGVYAIDRDYRVRAWNRKREISTLGIPREEAIGRSVFDVLRRQPADLLRREFDDVFATGQLQQFHMESRSTGELRTYRLTKLPVAGPDGAVSHVVTVGEDVTEWKAAVERSAQAEKLAAIGQLAAGVMHEINNPLATIAACAETMTLSVEAHAATDHPAPPGFAEYLRIVDHEVHRCRRIVEGLLNFSRPKPVERARVGVNAIVEQTRFLLKHHARVRRCDVRLELADGDGPAVTADVDQLTQVTMALVLNAVDAMLPDDASGEPDPDERVVTLRTSVTPHGEAVIEVADQGHGIAREDLPKVFEPFFTTKAPGKGTGLGLSICYGIVRDHGGRIEVESDGGAGSTFRVLIPRAGEGP